MRKLTPKELKALQLQPTLTKEQVEEIKKSIINSMNQVTSIGYKTPSYAHYPYKEYQEPEKDEQGVFYAYKVLKFYKGRFFSPMRPAQWSQEGFLEADRVPTEENTNGIYFCKTENDNELHNVIIARGYNGNFLVVKCALSGDVIEGETGFRSQYAQIIAVKMDREWINYEHWKDYQDTQERSQNRPRDYSQQEEWGPSRITYQRAWKAQWNSSPNVASEEDGESSE